MSAWLCDSSELISGAWLTSGYEGHGVLGGNIPSTGLDGPSALYGAVTLPGDAAKEIRGLITRWPVSGTLTIAEDGAFTYTGTSDYFDFALYVDGVASTPDIGYGAGVCRIFLAVGSGGSFSGSLSLASLAVAGLFAGVIPDAPIKPIRKTRYIPTGSVPGDAAGIQRFLQLEFERLNNALESPFTHDSYEVLHVEPGKKQTDRVYLAFADGSDWNPGSGRGFYYYDNGSWTFLG